MLVASLFDELNQMTCHISFLPGVCLSNPQCASAGGSPVTLPTVMTECDPADTSSSCQRETNDLDLEMFSTRLQVRNLDNGLNDSYVTSTCVRVDMSSY